MYYLYKKENILGVWKDVDSNFLKLDTLLTGKLSSAWLFSKVTKFQLHNGRWMNYE